MRSWLRGWLTKAMVGHGAVQAQVLEARSHALSVRTRALARYLLRQPSLVGLARAVQLWCKRPWQLEG